MAYTIKPAVLDDAKHLQWILTQADREEIQVSQTTPLSALVSGIRNSDRPVAVWDKFNRLAAVAGVIPQDPYGITGAPWMLSSKFAGTEPLAFVRQAKQWVADEEEYFQVLQHQVYRHNIRHVRLLKLLGFKIYEPRIGSQLFLRFEKLCASPPQSV